LARLSWQAWVALGIVGAVLAVAILPSTRWALLNQIHFLAGRYDTAGSHWGQAQLQFSAAPLDLRNRDESLARALGQGLWSESNPRSSRREAPSPLRSPHISGLLDHVRRFPDDVEAHAHLARRLAQSVSLSKTPSRNKRQAETHRQAVLEASEALAKTAEEGERLDPGNLYFPLMRAIALSGQNRPDEARREILDSAHLSWFQDYSQSESALLQEVIERHYGYRGEVLRISLLASTILPHMASIRNLVPELTHGVEGADRLRIQWALFREMHTLGRDGEALIHPLVAKSGMVLALGFPPGRQIDEGRIHAAAERLYRDIRVAGLAEPEKTPLEMLREIDRLVGAGRQVLQDAGRGAGALESAHRWTAFAAVALLLLASTVGAWMAVRSVAARHADELESARAALSIFLVLLAFLAYVVALSFSKDARFDGGAVAIPGLFVGLYAALAWQIARGQSARIATAALLLSGLVALMIPAPELFLMVTGAHLVLVLLAHFGMRHWTFTLLLVAVVGGIGYGVLRSLISKPEFLPLFVVGTFVAASLLVLVPARLRGATTLVGAALMALAYVAFLAADLAANQTWKAQRVRYEREAEEARRIADLLPLSPG
jgi:hypothetical protein